MQGIIDFFYNLVHWFFALVLAVINTVVSMLQDLFCWIVDQLLAVAVYVVGLFDFDFLQTTTFSDAVNQLPATMINVFWVLGLPVALGMVVVAIGIRLLLQLIPFVRLGS